MFERSAAGVRGKCCSFQSLPNLQQQRPQQVAAAAAIAVAAVVVAAAVAGGEGLDGVHGHPHEEGLLMPQTGDTANPKP